MRLDKRIVALWLWMASAVAIAQNSNTIGNPQLQHRDDIRITWAVIVAIIAMLVWGFALRKRNRMSV